MSAAAARRILLLLGLSLALTAALSIFLGLILGASLARSASLGFYLVGSFLLVAGFFLGNRGSVRLRGQPGDEGLFGLNRRAGVRMATPDERRDAIANTAVFVSLGLVLIVAGVLTDPRYSLY